MTKQKTIQKTTLKTDLLTIFSISIDGDWSAKEFSSLFDSINRIYRYNYMVLTYEAILSQKNDEIFYGIKNINLPLHNDFKVDFLNGAKEVLTGSITNRVHRTNIFTFNENNLIVKKIQFASPGSIDLAGLGKVFENIKDLFIHYLPNKGQKLDNVIKLKQIEEKEQQIIQAKISNLKSLGLSNTEIFTLIGLESNQAENIINIEKTGKITDFKIQK